MPLPIRICRAPFSLTVLSIIEGEKHLNVGRD